MGGVARRPATTASMAWLDARLTALGVRGVLGRDLLLAVVVAIVSVLVLLPLLGPVSRDLGIALPGSRMAVVLALVAAQALALVLRRLRPALCLLVVAGLQVALAAAVPEPATLRAFAPVIAAYSAATVLPVPRLARGLGPAVLVDLVGTALVTRPGLGAGLLTALLETLLYATAALTGLVVAARRADIARLRARAAAAVAEQETRTARAVEAERLRMARELHDIAAHHLTGLVVSATAAEKLLERDPAAARAAVHGVRAQGKQALSSLRLVVGMLRADDELVAPAPGLAGVDDLLATARTLGDDVALERSGTAYELAPVADVTAYRVLQEALTNARKHAPGVPVRVVLDHGHARFRLEVANAGPARADDGPPGYGLLGMQERAGLAGGALEAGPTADGGWRVRLDLPRTAAEVTR